MSGVDDTVVTAVKVEEAEVPVIEAEAPAPQDPAPVQEEQVEKPTGDADPAPAETVPTAQAAEPEPSKERVPIFQRIFNLLKKKPRDVKEEAVAKKTSTDATAPTETPVEAAAIATAVNDCPAETEAPTVAEALPAAGEAVVERPQPKGGAGQRVAKLGRRLSAQVRSIPQGFQQGLFKKGAEPHSEEQQPAAQAMLTLSGIPDPAEVPPSGDASALGDAPAPVDSSAPGDKDPQPPVIAATA